VRAARRNDQAQDGGAVTALLTALLAQGAIDGALVSAPSPDPEESWKGVPTIARTPAELRAASGSFYNQTMALASLDLSGYDLGPRPRIAVVGTPCEIEGLRAMQLRRWKTGAHKVEAVTLTIALMCTKSFDYEQLIRDELERRRHVDFERVSKIDITRGRLVVTYRDGAIAVDEPVKEFHGAALKGCDECADFLGRAADLAVGSVGSADGWTTLLVRSERGREAIDRARGALDLRQIDDVPALLKLDRHDQRVAAEALQRPYATDDGLFISYEEHAKAYAGSDRAPVEIRH
jgi:coenzyme F420 hydrogenase subunit beta